MSKKGQLKRSLSAVQGQLTKTEAKLNKARAKTKRWKTEASAELLVRPGQDRDDVGPGQHD